MAKHDKNLNGQSHKNANEGYNKQDQKQKHGAEKQQEHHKQNQGASKQHNEEKTSKRS